MLCWQTASYVDKQRVILTKSKLFWQTASNFDKQKLFWQTASNVILTNRELFWQTADGQQIVLTTNN